jgi:hypothetical protein
MESKGMGLYALIVLSTGVCLGAMVAVLVLAIALGIPAS